MKKIFISILILFLSFNLISCEKNEETKEVDTSEVEAVEEQPDITLDMYEKDGNVVIKKSLLGKEIIMLPTDLEETYPYTTTQVLGSKLVYFEKIQNALYMKEDVNDKTVTDPYNPAKIIAEFSIIAEDDEKIIFDFKKGFEKIIVNYPDFSSDDTPDMYIDIFASYLDSFSSENNIFSFNHIVQMPFSGHTDTATFNYAFLYEPREDMKAKEAPEDMVYGFFLTKPMYERSTGKEKKIINRWNISQPIVFHISSNTPEEYYEYVEDGILAWNKAFGREVIKVEKAPEEVISGDPRYNVVQWVGFDEAGFAYANWHAHPRTGEILNAYVILTSSFAVKSKERAKFVLEIIDRHKEAQKNRLHIGLSGFEKTSLCDGDFLKTFKNFLQIAALGELPDDRIELISKLFVKSVTIHEVGHILGLRHNFYGNLGSKIDLANNVESLQNILEQGISADGFLPSSSVMDYLDLNDDIRMHSPGVYDIAAISWGYDLENTLSSRTPLYCTDDDVVGRADCERDDGGSDPILWRDLKINEVVINMNEWIKDKYIDEIFIDLNENYFSERVNYFLSNLGMYLDASQKVLSIAKISSSERRAIAADIIGSYLKSSDLKYDSLEKLMTDDMQVLIDEQGFEKKQEIKRYLLSVRDFYVANMLSYLSQLTSFVGPVFGENTVSVEEGFAIPGLIADEQVHLNLANALATIIGNHISIIEPSEPTDFRYTAVAVLNRLDQNIVREIKQSIATILESNIAELENLLQTEQDSEVRNRIMQIMSEELDLLYLLVGSAS